MDHTKQQETCSLCGLVVEIEGFSLTTKAGELQKFCCAGCLSIYQLINDEQTDADDKIKTTPLTTQP